MSESLKAMAETICNIHIPRYKSHNESLGASRRKEFNGAGLAQQAGGGKVHDMARKETDAGVAKHSVEMVC